MDDTKRSATYEIRVRGILGDNVMSAFPALTGRAQDGVTCLSGCLADQAALFGVLDQVQSLGLELLSVDRAS